MIDNFGQITYIVLGIALLSLIIGVTATILAWNFNRKLKRFLLGKNGSDLEELISQHTNAISSLDEYRNESRKYFKHLDQRIKMKVGMVETVRFNPFPGTGNGGNQSFSSAFVNEEGSGTVISGIYSRDRSMVFSKPISSWQSEYELSDEEKKAIELSKNKNNVQ